MVESEKPLKAKDQIKADEQLARELAAEEEEAVRLEKEEALRQEQATIDLINSWDNTQAMVEANQLLAEMIQAKEQEELFEEQKASLLKLKGTNHLLKPNKENYILVKANHGNVRPEEEFERVLWGDLKVMFEPDTTSEVWKYLQGFKVTGWKLYDSCGVHYMRFKNLHIYMLVEKRYPLTPITIKNMLDNMLQADKWNEMVYQLLKLMVKQ
ncbi:hypothetical protein Tco_0149271 [Tanacetum coccineum]